MLKCIFPLVIIMMFLTGCELRKEITATQIEVSPLFSDHMVILKEDNITFRGKSSANSIVAVQIGNILKYGKSNASGKWNISFPPFERYGPFNIQIIGKDTIITFKDVVFGNVELLTGRFSIDYSIHKIDTSEKGSKIRLYTFPFSVEKMPEDILPRGKWLSTDLHFSDIDHLIGDSSRYNNLPYIGFILANEDLSGISSWIDRKVLEDADTLIADTSYLKYDSGNYDSLYLSMLDVLSFKDSLIRHSSRAIDRGILMRTFDDALWWKITLPGYRGNKHIGMRTGIKWMRKKVFIPSKYITGNFYLKAGQLPEPYKIYFNETEVTSQKLNDSVFIIPDSLIKIWTNILTLRLVKDKTDCIISGDSDDFVLYNSDTTFKSKLDGEWALSERQEPDLPEVVEIWEFPGVYYNAAIYPLRNIKINGFYWIDHVYPEFEKNKEVLTSFLIEQWSTNFGWTYLNNANE